MFNKLVQELTWDNEFKELVSRYNQAYQQENYSQEQLNIIEGALIGYCESGNQPQYALLEDAFSLCRQRIRMQALDQEKLEPKDFQRIVWLITEMEKIYPLKTNAFKLKVAAVAWHGLNNAQEVKNILRRLQNNFPQYITTQEKLFWHKNQSVNEFINKYY